MNSNKTNNDENTTDELQKTPKPRTHRDYGGQYSAQGDDVWGRIFYLNPNTEGEFQGEQAARTQKLTE